MHRTENLKDVFSKCECDGFLKLIEEVDDKKIQSMLKIANDDFETVQPLTKTLPKNSNGWATVYKLHYDILRQLVDAYLGFDKIKSSNHQCLFAHLCEKHQELELSWDFLEKIRTKRNGLLYYGNSITYQDWKDAELQFILYIKTIRKAVEDKLKK